MLPSAQFFPKHLLMLSTLRKALVPAELAQHMQRLAALMLVRLQRTCTSTCKVIISLVTGALDSMTLF